MSTPEPRTVYQETSENRSGGGGMVRAAVFPTGGAERSAVMLTLFVSEGFVAVHPDGSAGATLMLDPDEAREYADRLRAAADRAAASGPPLYS